MKSLMFLEAALLEGKTDEVSAYFSEIDRQTSNDMMKKAGLQFGFKTMEVMGMRVAHIDTASHVLGYSRGFGLSKLLSAYQIFTLKIISVQPEVARTMKEFFELSPKDSEATFLTWDGFCVGGMYGRNEAAGKIKVYLLKMEPIGRIALAIDPKFEYVAKNHELKRLEMSLKYICRIDGMKDGRYKDAAIDDYEKLTGRKLEKSIQQDLAFGDKK